MALAYKFPRLYRYLAGRFMPQFPGVSIPENLSERLPLKHLAAGTKILDLACGEGTLTLWLAEQRKDVHVFGVDLSHDMLAQARQKLEDKGLENVSFIEKSATSLTAEDFLADGDDITSTPLHMVTCSHGFTAMDSYEPIFDHTLSLLNPGGIYVIMDLYYPKRSAVTLLATHLLDGPVFGANQFRRPFLLIQEKMAEFAIQEESAVDFGFVPGVYYTARGVKRAQDP